LFKNKRKEKGPQHVFYARGGEQGSIVCCGGKGPGDALWGGRRV